MYKIYLILFCILASQMRVDATTICPYENLGKVADDAEAVYELMFKKYKDTVEYGKAYGAYEFDVKEIFKGPSVDEYVMKKFSWSYFDEKLQETVFNAIAGDYEFSSYDREKKFLVFIKSDQAICLNYYIFKEEKMSDGIDYMVHIDSDYGLIRKDTARYYYDKKELYKNLKEYLSKDPKTRKWKEKGNKPYEKSTSRAAPSHCSFLSAGSKPLRWEFFPNELVNIHDTENSVYASNPLVVQAVGDLSTAYEGISIKYGGLLSPIHDCTDASAIGADYRSYLDTYLGGYRNVVIHHEDPCSEVADLSSCGGTIAIGGAYGIGSHTYDGQSWASAHYGYVIMNNGVSACFTTTEIRQVITHEVTHTMGTGHISGSAGAANMNPSCCNDITSLDIACLIYTYVPCTPETHTFTGTVSADWDDSGNWDNGVVPDVCDIVIIPDGVTCLVPTSVKAFCKGFTDSHGNTVMTGMTEVLGTLEVRPDETKLNNK